VVRFWQSVRAYSLSSRHTLQNRFSFPKIATAFLVFASVAAKTDHIFLYWIWICISGVFFLPPPLTGLHVFGKTGGRPVLSVFSGFAFTVFFWRPPPKQRPLSGSGAAVCSKPAPPPFWFLML